MSKKNGNGVKHKNNLYFLSFSIVLIVSFIFAVFISCVFYPLRWVYDVEVTFSECICKTAIEPLFLVFE